MHAPSFLYLQTLVAVPCGGAATGLVASIASSGRPRGGPHPCPTFRFQDTAMILSLPSPVGSDAAGRQSAIIY